MMLLTYSIFDFHLFCDGAVDIQIWALLTRSRGKVSDTQVTVNACGPLVWFDISLPYLAHRCITMRRCVKYIHNPDTTLNFDLKVKFIGFLTCFRVRPITSFLIDIGLPYLAHWCIIIRRFVAYIHDPDLMFTMNLSLAECLCSLT